MGDTDRSSSPPLPKGTYNFNFDEFDENTNPFQTKKALSNSPPVGGGFSDPDLNPFQSRSKLGSSPPKTENTFEGVQDIPEDVSQTHSKFSHSPTPDQEPVNGGSSPVDNIEKVEQTKPIKTISKSSKSRTVETPSEEEDRLNSNQDGGTDNTQPKKQTKAASPKKNLKKPKGRTKFKPPPNFGAQEEDIQIFAPPKRPLSAGDPEEAEPKENEPISAASTALSSSADNLPSQEVQEVEPKESEPISVESCADNLPNQGPDVELIDSFHDFGAGEMPVEANEGFVPASEVFNEDDAAWEMMEKMHNEDNASEGRESLFVNFDPLSEGDRTQMPDKATRRTSNPDESNDDLLLMNTPPAKSTSGRVQSRHPAARALQEQVEGDGGPKEVHQVDKMLFSPGLKGDKLVKDEDGLTYYDARDFPPATGKSWVDQGENEVERLNTVNKKHGGDGQENIVQLVQVLKYSQSDWNKLKQELDLDYNARILNKEREWSKKLGDRDKRIAHLEEQASLLRASNEDMRLVVAEFEKTIAQIHADKEKTTSESQETFDQTVKERDQALEDLQSVESAFSDLHQRYERTKNVVEGLKKNEEVLKKCVQDYQVKLKTAEDKVINIRQQAEDKLEQAAQEMDKVRKTTTAEVARLEAALKKSDLKVQGLERSLEQKVKENQELTSICDELIAKVGGE